MNRTPEEAKKLVAGPLGRQMEMFPLRFCKPVYFGVPPSREHPVAVNNGTASLLDLRGDLLLPSPVITSSKAIVATFAFWLMRLFGHSFARRSLERHDVERFAFLNGCDLGAPQFQRIAPFGQVVVFVINGDQPAQRVIQAALCDQHVHTQGARVTARG
jgi:hypothetical protein